ncbi:MAG: hypothetical protein JXD21_07555, partial [Candidatus Omnitrophica bacterium]|nr:hypothetical protein [Candidatus Omnitrophota bacterium]
MSNNNKPFFIRLFFFCSLIALAFSFLPLYAQSPYDSKDTDSLFEACEAIIDKSLDNVIKDLVGIKAENKDLKNTLEEYRKLLEESSPDKVKDLQTEIRKLQEKVEGYKTSLTESLSRVETETNKNDKLQNAIKNLNDQISALKIEYNTLLENNASLKEIQHTQEETIDRLQVEVTQLEDTLGEKEESLRGLKDRPSLPPKQDIEPLQKEIQRYRSLLQEKETKADYYQDQLRQKEKAIADLTGELQTLEDRYQALIDSNQSSQTKGTQDQQIIAGLKGELLRIKERLSEKEALLAQAEQELSRFTSETKGAQSALQEDIERYKSLLSAKESELAQYTGDLKGANSALKEERRRFNELVKKLETIQEELASLTTQNKQLQEENNKMRSDRTAQLKEIDNLKKTITQLEDSLGEKKQEIAKKTSQAQEEKTLTSQQERQIVQYENQLRKKEQELGAAEKMIAQLTQSKEAL